MFNSIMMWVWLAVVIVCVVVELMTTSLTTIWFALSGVLMIFLSKLGIPLQWQVLIFLVLAFALLFGTRPLIMKKILTQKTNVNALEGQEVLVVKPISKFEKGEAKTKNGVVWTCVSENEEEIPVNATGIVTKVDGNTLIIKAKETITENKGE